LLALALTVATTVNAADGWIKSLGVNGTLPENAPMMKLKLNPMLAVEQKHKGKNSELGRLYLSIPRAGRKRPEVHIYNALCSQRDRQGLDKKMVVIFDGGSCYFNVKYDPSLERIFRSFY